MNRLPVALDALIAALSGLLLVAGGAWALAYAADVPAARTVATALDAHAVAGWPDRVWWPGAVAGLAVGTGLLGFGLLRLNMSRRPAENRPLPGADDSGSLTMALTPIAAAIAEDVRDVPGVRRATSRLLVDHARATLELHVVANPDTSDPAAIVARAARNAADLSAATCGADLAIRTHLHFDPYRHRRG